MTMSAAVLVLVVAAVLVIVGRRRHDRVRYRQRPWRNAPIQGMLGAVVYPVSDQSAAAENFARSVHSGRGLQ